MFKNVLLRKCTKRMREYEITMKYFLSKKIISQFSSQKIMSIQNVINIFQFDKSPSSSTAPTTTSTATTSSTTVVIGSAPSAGAISPGSRASAWTSSANSKAVSVDSAGSSTTQLPSQKASRCQFHQHFMSIFFVQKFLLRFYVLTAWVCNLFHNFLDFGNQKIKNL